MLFVTAFPEDFSQPATTFSCDHKNDSVLKSFPYPSNGMLNKTNAQTECEKYCGKNNQCQGCTLQCHTTCQWRAHTSCHQNKKIENTFIEELTLKPSKNRYCMCWLVT